MKHTTYQGFTLLELMIVIAIVGILVAIAIPSYHIYTRRAHYTEVIQAAAPYKTGIEECFQLTGTLTDCTAGINGVPPATDPGKGTVLVHSITVNANGAITVTPNNKYGIKPQDTYILTPVARHDQLHWETSGGGITAGYAN